MTKNISIAIVAIIILFLGIWYWRSTQPVSAPTIEEKTTEVTTQEINNDLQNIDIGNIDKDFDAVNANINTL